MLLAVVAVYLLVVQGIPHLINQFRGGAPIEYGSFSDVTALVLNMIIPVGASVLLVVGLISYLGWWHQVLHEGLRLRRWAWIFPIMLVVSILLATNYPNLASVGFTMTASLLVGTLLVGTGEELMFRGVALESLRRSKRTNELQAALWSVAIFGLAHITNIFTEGPGAFFQVVVVTVSGLYFYIARRVSGGIWLPILLHAGWDFSLFSSQVGDFDGTYALAFGVPIATNVVLFIVLLVRWRQIWPKSGQQTPDADKPAEA